MVKLYVRYKTFYSDKNGEEVLYGIPCGGGTSPPIGGGKNHDAFSFLSTVLLNDKFVLMTCHQGEYVKHNRSIGMIDR